MYRVVLSILVVCLILTACTGRPGPVFEQGKTPIPRHTVLNEDVYDVPGKTQVKQDVLVSGDISEEGLRTLLGQLYSGIMARRGFQHHDVPTNVYIYAFTSKERAGSRLWIAMLAKHYDDAKPTISVNEGQVAQLGAKPEERFGLSEEKRKGIWQEIVRAESRAFDEAEGRYPYPFHKHMEVGGNYRLSEQTPLMPEIHATDALAALEKTRYIPAGGTIEIVEIANEEGPPWYYVQARGIGMGWVDSVYLIGQFDQENQQRLEDQFALLERLIEEYRAEIARRYGLTREQLEEIGREAIEEYWPSH